MTPEESLQQLQQTLLPYLPLMANAAEAVRDQDISNYPVFAVFPHSSEVGVGLPLVDGTASSHGWSVNVTTLEELAANLTRRVDAARRERPPFGSQRERGMVRRIAARRNDAARRSRSAVRAASAKNPERFFATLSIAATSPSSNVTLTRIDFPGRSARTNIRATSSISGSWAIESKEDGEAS